MLNFVDAFSGAGGLALGLQRAGLEPLLSFDFDDKCIETHKLNKKYFKHSCEKMDINNLLKGKWKKFIDLNNKELFLLAGGPPCQGFSVQRIGSDEDERNDLVVSFIKLACELKPKFFLMENVAGLKGKRGLTTLNKAISIAEKNGYYIHQKVMDAQDFGVPQRRKRIIVVGEKLTDGDLPVFYFPDPKNKKTTVRDAIGALPDVLSNREENAKITHHVADKLSELNRKRLMALKQGQGMKDLPKNLLAECHKLGASKIGHRNVYGRMKWDDVAPTITARFDSFTRGQFGHPENIRSISLREGALLQTFPVDFNFSGNKVDIARQIGNAVPPKLGEVIGRQIIKCFENKKARAKLKIAKQLDLEPLSESV